MSKFSINRFDISHPQCTRQQGYTARARERFETLVEAESVALAQTLAYFFTKPAIFMFDFEKLEVYSKAKKFHHHVQGFLLKANLDTVIRNQLKRAALSIPLNIAEGSGRKTKADKRNFLIISRGSVFECVSVLDILKDEGSLKEEEFKTFYYQGEELSKMLYTMIQRLE